MFRAASRTFLVAALIAAPSLLPAQMQIPEKFTNLQILPKDMPREQLLGVMRRFTSSLGMRCDGCHVNKAQGGPPQFDFAADDKETKQVARGMMKMVGQINNDIGGMGRTLSQRNRVGCSTCHRGVSKPRSMSAELVAAIEAKGIDSAVTRYRELRERYYGRYAYDFGESSLVGVAEELAMDKKTAEAERLLQLNLEFYPKGAQTWSALAQGQAMRGDTAAAIETVNKGLAADPENPMLKRLLAGLKGEGRRP